MKLARVGPAGSEGQRLGGAQGKGQGQGDDAGRGRQRAGLAGGCGGDELVYGIAGGDGGEPGAQADMLIQRGQGVQVSLLQRSQQRGGRQDGQ